MKILKSLKLALNILVHSKLRSWLTIIGIVIGVAAVVAIVSIGEGMQQSIEERLGGLGADIITVSPGGGRASGGFRGFEPGRTDAGSASASATSAKNLTQRDVQALKSLDNIAGITGIVSGRGEAYYLSQKANVQVNGVDQLAWKDITTSELDSGRFLGPSDLNMVVVGSRIAKNTFKKPLALNRNIEIEGKSFKIVGVLKESGGMDGDDNRVIMDITSARLILEDAGTEKLDSIIIKAKGVDAVDALVADADKKLTVTRHVTARNKDFSVTSAKAQQQRMTDITSTMTLFLGAIAAVSLIVGAIGIANTMFTSVLEKTKEIGIMKAIGARNRDILMIFLFNSAMVGLVGGLIGIALGAAASSLVPMLGFNLPMPGRFGGLSTALNPVLLLETLSIAIFTGIAAGVIPAYRASRLRPVDALRYE